MLPTEEIEALIAELNRANELISNQESRIEFMEDSGEDVAEFKANLAKAIEKRNKIQRALEKQVNNVTKSTPASSNRKPAKNR